MTIEELGEKINNDLLGEFLHEEAIAFAEYVLVDIEKVRVALKAKEAELKGALVIPEDVDFDVFAHESIGVSVELQLNKNNRLVYSEICEVDKEAIRNALEQINEGN